MRARRIENFNVSYKKNTHSKASAHIKKSIYAKLKLLNEYITKYIRMFLLRKNTHAEEWMYELKYLLLFI